ncbi:MAG: hypothetical protein U5L96_01810 [Owenweeksia sp.]|nr:hypothetical protein [Owenweeksia sp.]
MQKLLALSIILLIFSFKSLSQVNPSVSNENATNGRASNLVLGISYGLGNQGVYQFGNTQVPEQGYTTISGSLIFDLVIGYRLSGNWSFLSGVGYQALSLAFNFEGEDYSFS